VIIANTVPGKGVSYMEGDYTWHGKPPNKEQAAVALQELEAERERILARAETTPMPETTLDGEQLHLHGYTDITTIAQIPTRNGFGEGLIEAGNRNKNVLAICADLAESTRMEGFKKAHPVSIYRDRRCGTNARCDGRRSCSGWEIPWIASYAMFNPGRSWNKYARSWRSTTRT